MQSLYSHVVPKADVKFLKCFQGKFWRLTDQDFTGKMPFLLLSQQLQSIHTHWFNYYFPGEMVVTWYWGV